MTVAQDAQTVLAWYRSVCGAARIEPLGSAGGFSGARFWRIAAAGGTFCLRRWPAEHPSQERLRFIHAVLARVHQHRVPRVPHPLPAASGRSFVNHGGHLWELTPWLSGRADYALSPTEAKLRAAMQALAQFHLAATPGHAHTATTASPGVNERIQLLRRLRQGQYDQIRDATKRIDLAGINAPAHKLLALFSRAASRIHRELNEASRANVPLQPCIRDVWHDHILFEGRQVSGIIDFGAMRTETVAADVARLLGSLAADDQHAWKTGLDAYARIRPISADEQRLVRVFDRSTVLLAGMNWLRWLYLDRRQFEDARRVRQRLDETVGRLQCLVHHL